MRTRIRILALDLATKCGYAVSKRDSGMWNLTTKPKELKALRMVRLRQHIDEVHQRKPIQLIAYEDVRACRHIQATIVLSELQGVVKVWGVDHDVSCVPYTAGQIKKHATGKGNAKKPEMIATAEEFFEVDIVTDDHADALWLWHLARSEWKKGVPCIS